MLSPAKRPSRRGASNSPSLASFFAIGLLISGCAGSMVKIEPSTELPKELPKEIQAKFEVKDVAQVEAEQAAESAKGKRKKAKTRKAGGKKARAILTSAGSDGTLAVPFAFPNRRPAHDPIWLHERQVYEVTYFGMAAGNFTLETLPYKVVANRKVYHARGLAVTSKVFSLFYRLNDTVETFFDYEGLFSHRFHVVLDESKQTRDALELNDAEKGQTYYWNRWNRSDAGYTESKEFDDAPRFAQDSLSALYYIRTLPLKDGEVTTFPVISEGKNWEAVVTVVRRETINTPLGKLATVVVKPETKFQGVLQKKGDSFLWFTDDDRRILVRMEAKVKVGTLVARLTDSSPGEPSSPGQPAPTAPSGAAAAAAGN